VTRTGSLHDRLGDRWTYALLPGLGSLPLTTVAYWQSGSELSLSPVLLAGVLAGYLSKRRTDESAGVGVRTGLVGGLSVVWVLVDVLRAASALAGPPWFVAAGVVFTAGTLVLVAVVGFGLAALAGAVGGRIGGWLAGRAGGPGSTTAGR
jgi:hypothetical protein